MRKKTLSLLLIIALSLFTVLPASADVLFMRQTNFSNTALGVINGGSEPVSPLITNMGGDYGQGIFGYTNAEGGYRVAISLYGPGAAADTINIYSPGAEADWSKPDVWEKPAAEFTTSLLNTRTMREMGGYLYGISYGNPIVSKISTSSDDYREVATREFKPDDEEYTAHGEGLVAYNGSLYAIFSAAKGSYGNYSYMPNTLIKLDANLEVTTTLALKGLNFDGGSQGAYALSGSTLYVASVGGNQPYGTLNEKSAIEAVDLSAMTAKTLLTAADVYKKDSTFNHFFKAVVPAGDKIYIQAVEWKADFSGYSMRVYETTADKLAAGDIGTMIKDFTGKGWTAGMSYDPATGYLWAATGTSINRYDGSEWKTFDNNALQGDLTQFAIANVPAAPTPDSGSSGGCNAGVPAFMALALIPLFLRGKKRTK